MKSYHECVSNVGIYCMLMGDVMHDSQSPSQYRTWLRDLMGQRGSGVHDGDFDQTYGDKCSNQSLERMIAGCSLAK